MTRYLVIQGLAFPAEFIFDVLRTLRMTRYLVMAAVSLPAELFLGFLQNLEIEYRLKNSYSIIYSFCHVFHKLDTCTGKKYCYDQISRHPQ